jgi:hypothetical protein
MWQPVRHSGGPFEKHVDMSSWLSDHLNSIGCTQTPIILYCNVDTKVFEASAFVPETSTVSPPEAPQAPIVHKQADYPGVVFSD